MDGYIRSLIDALTGASDEDARRAAMIKLRQAGYPRNAGAADALIALVRSRSYADASWAAFTLAEMGPGASAAVEPIVEMILRGPESERISNSVALVRIGTDESLKALADVFGRHWKAQAFALLAGEDRPELTRKLLDWGLSPNAKLDGFPILYLAAATGHCAIARQLLERGAGVDAVSQFGNTPLYDAIKLGHRDMAALLVEFGADPGRENLVEAEFSPDGLRYETETPLQYAQRHGREDLMPILRAAKPLGFWGRLRRRLGL